MAAQLKRSRQVFAIVVCLITYLPHEAVAEVSKNKEPIGRRCGIQLVRRSVDFRFNRFEFQLF